MSASIEEQFAEIARVVAREEINRTLDLIARGIANAHENAPPPPAPPLQPLPADRLQIQAAHAASSGAPTPPRPSPYMPLAEASATTHRPKATIYSAIKAGHLSSKKIRNRVYVKRADLAIWADGGNQ